MEQVIQVKEDAMLKRLYAVTKSASLYLITDELNEYGWPTVVKIAESKSSNLRLGR